MYLEAKKKGGQRLKATKKVILICHINLNIDRKSLK